MICLIESILQLIVCKNYAWIPRTAKLARSKRDYSKPVTINPCKRRHANDRIRTCGNCNSRQDPYPRRCAALRNLPDHHVCDAFLFPSLAMKKRIVKCCPIALCRGCYDISVEAVRYLGSEVMKLLALEHTQAVTVSPARVSVPRYCSVPS